MKSDTSGPSPPDTIRRDNREREDGLNRAYKEAKANERDQTMEEEQTECKERGGVG